MVKEEELLLLYVIFANRWSRVTINSRRARSSNRDWRRNWRNVSRTRRHWRQTKAPVNLDLLVALAFPNVSYL